MAIPNLHDVSLLNAQMRAVSLKMGEPYSTLPVQSTIAAIAKHGGMYTLLDPDLMTARMVALIPDASGGATALGRSTSSPTAAEIAMKLREVAVNFFYKLVDRTGYTIHSELMAYIAEPGKGNGVAYDEGADASPTVPAAFTFVGQFIDHDLTFNGMNLTADERGVAVKDDASPVIDLDSVYGPRGDAPKFNEVFDKKGRFKLKAVGNGYDLPRHQDQTIPDAFPAVILDPRNDENQLILQVHILVQRFHNKLIDSGVLKDELKKLKDVGEIVDRVRREVVATWQSFVLNEYMRAIIRNEILDEVLEQIHVPATDPKKPQEQYGNLKHKPYKDLVTGKNVVRMPHEFAIGFRFGHSQLRPAYVLNKKNVVLLFKDARASDEVTIEGLPPIKVSGKDDLRGNRHLKPEHVIDWSVFHPKTPDDKRRSLRIDHKVTARVFNLPESAIPDDIKYIGNLAHRNLIRSSQIGIVSGEELAEFYGLTKSDILTPAQVLGDDAGRDAAKALFELDHKPEEKPKFKTPLWYYFLKEAELQSDGGKQLGKVGSRLVAEVLAGALYYGNDFPFDDNWTSSAIKPAKPKTYGTITLKDSITLQDIIDFVNKP